MVDWRVVLTVIIVVDQDGFWLRLNSEWARKAVPGGAIALANRPPGFANAALLIG